MAYTSTRANQFCVDNMWRKAVSGEHDPCTDGCELRCINYADIIERNYLPVNLTPEGDISWVLGNQVLGVILFRRCFVICQRHIGLGLT